LQTDKFKDEKTMKHHIGGSVRRNSFESIQRVFYVGDEKSRSLFQTFTEIIRLAVIIYIRFQLSLRNVEDLLHERGIVICHETVRYWWHRFDPIFAAEIHRKRAQRIRFEFI
jgi:hypothetical protein